MRNLFRVNVILSVMAAGWLLTAAIAAQAPAPPVIPNAATALEGVPASRVDVTPEGTSRRQLDGRAGSDALKVTIVNGRYFWASRNNTPLTVSTSGEFTYLSSDQPGQYIRFRRVNDRLTYVEHVDMGLNSVTYWGELRIVVGK